MIKNNGVPQIVEEHDYFRSNVGSNEQIKAAITIIDPAFKIEDKLMLGQRILENLERYGRKCYKSEKNISGTSAAPFLEHAINIGHFSIIEHEKITVSIIIDRGISHEWVRHRIAAYSQESTRYVNYGKRGFQYIRPLAFARGSLSYQEWLEGVKDATFHYLKLLRSGEKPEYARGLLPNSLKTELVATHNIRQWRHIFYQRGDRAAHEQFRQILLPICAEFKKRIPILFDDLEIDWTNRVIKIKPKEELLRLVDRIEKLFTDALGDKDDNVLPPEIADLKDRIKKLTLAT